MKITPYSSNIIVDNSNNYGTMKTETVFGFVPNQINFARDSPNATATLEWSYSTDNFTKRARQVDYLKPSKQTSIIPPRSEKQSKKSTKTLEKKHGKKGKMKFKKCLLKLIKGGKKKRKMKKLHKKYMILGILVAKSLLIIVALKVLAFISTKGLMMGFFSTMMASFLSIKGMFDHSHAWHRKADEKTQIEIIQVPTKSDEHIHYDEYYKRGDYLPWKVVK